MIVKLIKNYIIPIVVLGFIIFAIISSKKDANELEKNPAFGYAVIVETYVGAKAIDYVKYEFIVAGKVFRSDQNYMIHKQHINIGDSCKVVYAKTNPKISRLLTDDNKLIIIVNKNIQHKKMFNVESVYE